MGGWGGKIFALKFGSQKKYEKMAKIFAPAAGHFRINTEAVATLGWAILGLILQKMRGGAPGRKKAGPRAR